MDAHGWRMDSLSLGQFDIPASLILINSLFSASYPPSPPIPLLNHQTSKDIRKLELFEIEQLPDGGDCIEQITIAYTSGLGCRYTAPSSRS